MYNHHFDEGAPSKWLCMNLTFAWGYGGTAFSLNYRRSFKYKAE